MTNTCSTCRYCVEARQGHEINKQYLCYKNPPSPFPVPMQGGVAVMAIRPVVTEHDWCGRYVMKLTAGGGNCDPINKN